MERSGTGKINHKIWGVLFFIGVIYLFSGKSMDGGSFFTAYMMFVGIGLSAGTISYDTSDHGMQFLLTLPVTRREYVKEKYLFCIGLTAVLGVISLLISMLVYRKVNIELLVSAGCCFLLRNIVSGIDAAVETEIRRQRKNSYGRSCRCCFCSHCFV